MFQTSREAVPNGPEASGQMWGDIDQWESIITNMDQSGDGGPWHGVCGWLACKLVEGQGWTQVRALLFGSKSKPLGFSLDTFLWL